MYLIYSFTYISMDCGIIWLKSSLLWLFHLSSCVPLTCSCRFGFRVLPYFLTFLDAPGSCIFPAPALEWAISPKNLGSFYWEMVFRNQDLDSGSAHCYWSVIASRPSHVTELGNMCVYIYILMATHSSVLAWRIPGTGEPGGLPSMGSHRVGHNWSDLAAAAYILTHVSNLCK